MNAVVSLIDLPRLFITSVHFVIFQYNVHFLVYVFGWFLNILPSSTDEIDLAFNGKRLNICD